ncbi:MAG: response regulator [Planctomycetota bacterium]
MAPPTDPAPAHVLLVDDEANLLRVLKRGLELAGFKVTAVADAAAATAALADAATRPDILVTDLSMPGASGIELAREARAALPDLPVLLCTGFVHKELEQEALEAGVTRLLDKPLQVRSLADVIREVLAG